MPNAALNSALLLCLACATSPRLHSPRVETDPPEAPRVEALASSPTQEVRVRSLLSGRFDGQLPNAAEPANIWPSNRPGERDAWRVPYEGCELVLAVSSEGLVRPSALSLGDGESRSWVPSEAAESRLEVITAPSRTFDILDMTQAAVGAVVFEPDGNATDFFLWPDAPEREGFGEEGEEDWIAWQRNDPALRGCYESAERLLGVVLASLQARRPFEPRPARLSFGWDEASEEQATFAGSLPPGWLITTSDAFDTSFERVHRRQDWGWSPGEPSPRAVLWMFSGEDDRRTQGARETVFGYPLRFDQEGCARVVEPRMPYQQYICLHGSRAEKRELLDVLQRFLRDTSP